jgi:hypothetical protein
MPVLVGEKRQLVFQVCFNAHTLVSCVFDLVGTATPVEKVAVCKGLG